MQIDMIKHMERIARKDPSIISLGQGIPAGGADKCIHDSVVAAMRQKNVDQYSDPQGIVLLRSTIAQATANEGMTYTEDETIVTSGAIEAINVALHYAVTNLRKKVIIPTPTYSAYFNAVSLSGGVVSELACVPSSEWDIDLGQLESSVDESTAAVLLSNPNNPTGTCYSRQTLEAIAEIAQKAGALVIVDEVYRHMLYDAKYYSLAESRQYKKDILRVTSFSKDFNMTGWRVGYIQADSSRVDALLKVHDTLVNCTSVVSQYAGVAALEKQHEIVKTNLAVLRHKRKMMSGYLGALSNVISYQLPSAGYFFFVNLHGRSDKKVADDLLKRGVVVVPGSAFGAAGVGCLRLCFGREYTAIEIGMKKIVEYFRETA